MSDAPTPASARPDPTWAFGAAAASLACAFVGAHLVSTQANARVAEIATVLAAMALPGWLAVAAALANVPPDGAWPTARMRALTILAAIVMTGLGLVSIGLLLFLASRAVGIAFAVACVLALVWLDRVLAARR